MADDTHENPKQEPFSNAEKDPHDWTTGDEKMTGAQASYLKTLVRRGARGIRSGDDEGGRFVEDRRVAGEDRAREVGMS